MMIIINNGPTFIVQATGQSIVWMLNALAYFGANVIYDNNLGWLKYLLQQNIIFLNQGTFS
jgi:hypothetical protein